MQAKRQCSVTVFGERVQNWQCTRQGVIERDGKWYCRQHDPEAVTARRKASDERYDAKARQSLAVWKEREEQRENADRFLRLLPRLSAIKNHLRWIRGFCIAHHARERSGVHLHRLTIDLPQYLDSTIEALEAAMADDAVDPVKANEIEVCLGCGARTSERDCGCPAGTGWILARRECSGCGSLKVQCDAWKRHGHAACCPDCKHPEGK